ncbi:MAG: hypothetical protein WCJ19_04895 [bacterium]
MNRIIFIHGISDKIIDYDYSAELKKNLIEYVKNAGNSSNIEEFITFENINYSSIGYKEEAIVLDSYKEDSNEKFNVIDKTIDYAFFYKIREQLISSVSDVLVYESDYWRNQIRDQVLTCIDKYINTSDDVTIIAHSLGSVVAFDTIYYNVRHNPKWIKAGFKPLNLFTLGSPIALFSLELDETGIQKPRYIPNESMTDDMNPKNTNPDMNIIKDSGVWYNIFDAQDLIGYPLETLFRDKFKVKDIIVQTGTNPLIAHEGYWKSEKVANIIAEKINFSL